MLNGLLSYSGIVVKVQAKRSHMLKESDYRHIASLVSLREVADFLGGFKGYKHISASLGDAFVDRVKLEQLVNQSYLDDYQSIRIFATDDKKDFIQVFFTYYEIIILKQMIRKAMNHLNIPFNIATLSGIFEKHTTLKLEKLKDAVSYAELLEGVEGSVYYDVLKGTENFSIFDIDLLLDKFYFDQCVKKINGLRNLPMRKPVRQLLLNELDMINVLWLFRGRFSYGLDAQKLQETLVPHGNQLAPKLIERLIYSEDASDFLGKLAKSPLRDLAFKLKDQSVHSLNCRIEKALYNLYEQCAKKTPFSVLVIIKYLYFKRLEIKNIIALIECIEYGMKQEESLSHLILKRSGGD